MSWWDGVRHRIGTVLFPTRYAEALKEEFEHHLALAAVNEGADGRRQFGNPTVRREEVRSLTWLGRLDVLRQDWNHVRRSVGRDPGTTALIVATLALGVGANAATFAVLDRLYFRTPEGVARPGELRRFWVEHFRTGNGVPFTSPILGYPEYLVLANSAPNPHSVAGYGIDYDLHLGPGLGGTRVRATYASANYAAVLGLRMERGRFFLPSEDQMGQGAAVAVVSNRFWREHQGGRPEAIGETIAIGRRKYQVIGVIDRDFDGLEVRASDVWIPLASRPAPSWAGRWWEAGDVNGLQAVARWPTNDPIAAAESRATNLMRQFQRQTAGARADTLRRVYLGSIIAARGPATPGQELLIASRLAGVAAIVLLISLANVISLLLARALEQQREVAVRLALGISRGRLVRLLTLEAVALALIAGLAAGLIGWSGGSLLRTLLLPEVEWTEPALDGRVILFTAIITLGVGLLTGLPTAIRTSRPDVTAALKSGSRQSGRDRSVVRSGLVVAQTALSVILLVGAALFIASLSQVRALDLGFDIDGLVVAGVEYPEGAAPPSGVIATKLREIVG